MSLNRNNSTSNTTTTTNIDWIENSNKDFSDALYLTAIGSADAVEAAQDRALANLAKIFSVTIKHRSYSSIQVKQENSNSAVSQDNSQTTQTLTDQIIKGAEVKKRAQHPLEKQWYALAVLKKSKARQILSSKMDDMDKVIESYLQQLDNASKLRRVKILRDSIELQQDRATINDKYKVVSSSGYSGQHDKFPFNKKFQAARQGVSLNITAKDSTQDYNLTAAINESLAKQGFIVANTADYNLVSSIQVGEISKRNDWYWQNAVILIDLLEGDNKVGTIKLVARVATRDESLMTERLAQKIQNVLNKELVDAMLGLVS